MLKFLSSLLLAASLASVVVTASATESVRKADEPHSFFDRYTNAAQDVILQGLKLVGVRYRLGGNDESSGLDCSGFVRVIFDQAKGLVLPRKASEQAAATEVIDKKDLQPGDLVFFNTMRRAFSHVGIYVGDGKFIHAPRSGAQVRVEDMGVAYWARRFNGARRVAANDQETANLAASAR